MSMNQIVLSFYNMISTTKIEAAFAIVNHNNPQLTHKTLEPTIISILK